MIPVPLIILLSATGGTVLGCAIRQPEISKLKRQIRDLQKDNSKIKKLMYQQQETLENLMREYAKLKFYQVLQKRSMKQYVRGQILIGYEYKEYIDLLKKAIQDSGTEKFSEEEKQFFEFCGHLIGEEYISDEEEKMVNAYIMKKYKKEILYLKDANPLKYLESAV